MELNNCSCEPMDVDLSSNSISAMDISYNENIIIKTEETCNITNDKSQRRETNFKKLIVNLNATSANSKNRNSFLYALGIFFLFLGIYFHLKINYQCCQNLDTGKIRNNLSNRLYGQTIAVSQIIETLESDIRNRILFMYGGTGVGKTFAVSIILEDTFKFANVYHYTMKKFINLAASEILFGLTWCQSAIVIVDDLRHNDIIEIKEFVQTLVARSESLTVILNFNCDIIDTNFSSKCSSNFANELKNNFSDVPIEKKFIEFSDLDNDALRKCVENELGNKIVTEEQMRHLLRNFDVGRDGCKGVHQKIKLFEYNLISLVNSN